MSHGSLAVSPRAEEKHTDTFSLCLAQASDFSAPVINGEVSVLCFVIRGLEICCVSDIG